MYPPKANPHVSWVGYVVHDEGIERMAHLLPSFVRQFGMTTMDAECRRAFGELGFVTGRWARLHVHDDLSATASQRVFTLN